MFGRTLNPVHLGLTAGGLAGRQGTRIVSKAGVVVIAIDFTGRMRIPSPCNDRISVVSSHGLNATSAPGARRPPHCFASQRMTVNLLLYLICEPLRLNACQHHRCRNRLALRRCRRWVECCQWIQRRGSVYTLYEYVPQYKHGYS